MDWTEGSPGGVGKQLVGGGCVCDSFLGSWTQYSQVQCSAARKVQSQGCLGDTTSKLVPKKGTHGSCKRGGWVGVILSLLVVSW